MSTHRPSYPGEVIRFRSPRTAAAGTVAAMALVASLAGCVSSQDVEARSAGGSVATPSVDSAAVCPPLTGAELTRITGVPFQPRPVVVSSAEDSAECRWAATNGEAFIVTRSHSKNAEDYFRQAMASAQRNLGATARIAVKGADAAFAVPNVARFGLVDDSTYVEVNTVVPEATAEVLSRILTETTH